jgi:hypothetical protein
MKWQGWILVLLVAIIVPATTILSIDRLEQGRWSEVWKYSSREGPPDNGIPFVGAWLRSGKLEIALARRVGSQYFEYNPNPGAAVAFYGMQAPTWWVTCPGTALPERMP